MSLRVRYTPAASRSPRCLPTSCTRFRLPNQSRSFHSLKISHRPSVFVASRCSILNRTLSRTPARSMDSLLSKNSLNINRNHCIVFPISSRGMIRRFSTDPIEVEPSNRKAAFVLNHSGLIFFLPLAVFAVLCIIYVYESTIAEHPYIASVKATLVSGTRSLLLNDTTIETPLYSSEEISAYLPHITALLRTNDSPSFHPSYWLLTAPNVELVRQLLRAALPKEEPGIVYFRATDATTIGQELCKLFSVNYSDPANGIHTTLRKIITGPLVWTEPNRSLRDVIPTIMEASMVYRRVTGRLPALIIDGVDLLSEKNDSIDLLQRFAADAVKNRKLVVLFVSSDPAVQSRLLGSSSFAQTLQLPLPRH